MKIMTIKMYDGVLGVKCTTCNKGLIIDKPSDHLIPIPRYQYEEMYRDYAYRNLSANAKSVFFAINIHPSCRAKKGFCIPRAKCIEKKMFYIARVCYWWELVCCYEDYPPARNPVIAMLRTEDHIIDNSSHILTPSEYSKQLNLSDAEIEKMMVDNTTVSPYSYWKTELPPKLHEQPKTKADTILPPNV
ncbi:uncharacterized protein LOC126381781 [Pectinophora gossypiella]|uniref:uncharacterized protein LOC126381781 n=1 Tax=Pectinophora gossypiella TaxID=13191 RepID=UPI00214E6413|nr:uncharacterized protein LOC126381781 [Pectinophora gossypiella]